MKYALFLHTDRAKFLLEDLGENAKVVRQYIDDIDGFDWTHLEITIDSSIDIMNIFHSGIRVATAAFKS